jgi:hypothetical protein
MIDHRNRNRTGHILTVEDPIEYLFKHRKSVVNQREVGIDTRAGRIALRNAMRQAPDCILIGEIRDRETMQAALPMPRPATCAGHLAREQCLSRVEPDREFLPAGEPFAAVPRSRRRCGRSCLSAWCASRTASGFRRSRSC